MDQTGGAGDVGVDDLTNAVPVLIKKSMPQTAAGIGHQQVNLAPLNDLIELVDTFDGGKVGLNRHNGATVRFVAQRFQSSRFRSSPRSGFSPSAQIGKLKTNAGRGACHDRKLSGHWPSPSWLSAFFGCFGPNRTDAIPFLFGKGTSRCAHAWSCQTTLWSSP